MKKSFSILISLLITLFFISIFYDYSKNSSNRESVVVTRVIDGDTLKLKDGRTIRLLNINSPEKDFFNYNLSFEFLKGLEGKEVEVEVIGKDKYLRYLARIYAPDYINLELVKRGFASKYLVEKSELKDFSSSEKEAIHNSRGIWSRSEFFGCISIKVDEKQEYVMMTNLCDTINLFDWRLKDESRKVYVFKNISIGVIKLHSFKGLDSNEDIYWNQSQDVWNNDRDSIYLFDEKGKIVSYHSYGY